MFRLAILLAALALVSPALPASAQLRPFTIGIAGGPSTPMGDFGDEAGTGYHVQGSLGLSIPLLPVGVRADVLWQDFPDEAGGAFTDVGAMVNATLGIPLLIARPYLLGGVGLFRQSSPDAAHGGHAHAGGTENVTGFAVGAGLEVSLLGLGGAVEARYLHSEERRSVPISVGIRF